MKFKRGKLYCLSNQLWGNNIYKIGNTAQTIKSRLSTIQTSLYLDCEIVYQTTDLVCCKCYEKLLENILLKYRVNPRREFYYISKEEIMMIFDFFSQLNNQLNDEKKLIEYIQEYNPEYLKKKRIYKIDNYYDEKTKMKKKALFVDTSY
jgi:hypothetical protein